MIVYHLTHRFTKLVAAVFFRLRVHGREHMPEQGGALLVANHVSFLDPPLIGAAFRQPIHFLARKTLFQGPLAWLFPRIQVMAVDRGKGDMGGLKRVLSTLKNKQRVLLFPEGTRSPDGSLQGGEAGVGFIIGKCGVPVVPMRIFGAYECFPRTAKFPRPGKVTIVCGPPIDFSTISKELTGRELYQAYTDEVMAAIGRIELPE